jgi:DNA topoisomerase-2
VVETGDSNAKKLYRQVFSDNMSKKKDPVITEKQKTIDFTCVTFTPDLKRFKMDRLDEDIVALFTKRVYDMAGCTDSKVKVQLNGSEIPIKNFKQYVDLYLKNEEAKELPVITQLKSDRWEVICSLSDGSFQQVSFVNSICTTKGGTHVEYIVD